MFDAVLERNAWNPKAVLLSPVWLAYSESSPKDVLFEPTLNTCEYTPTATFFIPVVTLLKAPVPTAIFLNPVVLALNAQKPNAVLASPVVLLFSAQKPTAVLFDAVLDCNA